MRRSTSARQRTRPFAGGEAAAVDGGGVVPDDGRGDGGDEVAAARALRLKRSGNVRHAAGLVVLSALLALVSQSKHLRRSGPVIGHRHRMGGAGGAGGWEGGPVSLLEDGTSDETSEKKSDAPLFFHVSPGTTGSRSLYHAACNLGFPSVHHGGFCISPTRGIRGVDPAVTRGVRAHAEVHRLYTMVEKCTKIHDHGNSEFGTGAARQLCHTPLDQWVDDVRRRLAEVMESDVVGLFDVPYANFAAPALEAARARRRAPPIVALTERPPEQWAKSRGRGHDLLVCKEEHSRGRLEASEFDVVGCAERAIESLARADEEGRGGRQPATRTAHFWDAFQFLTKVEASEPKIQEGMARQMDRHQELYRPLAAYAPDIFRVRNESHHFGEYDIAAGIRRCILGDDEKKGGMKKDDGCIGMDKDEGVGVFKAMRPLWRERYAESVGCRGRLHWVLSNDTVWEEYPIRHICNAPSKESDMSMLPLFHVDY
ncbi:hypothetical protein ACHAWF_012033 [Thalassiosira exigua]